MRAYSRQNFIKIFSRNLWNSVLLLLFLILGLYVVPVDATEDEQLLFVLPDNWIEIYTDRTENLSTSEYIPNGQTEEDWSEMISVQILLEAGNSDPDLMLTKVANHLKKECSNLSIKPIQLTGISNTYPSVTMQTFCERKNDRDKGEVGIVRGIAGKESFYLLQKIWRTKPFRSEEEVPINLEQRKFWLGYIAYLGICNPKLNNCPENISQ